MHWPIDLQLRLEELEVVEWNEKLLGAKLFPGVELFKNRQLHYHGTRIKGSNLAHGIVRKIQIDGAFYDSTFVNGLKEGLQVYYWPD